MDDQMVLNKRSGFPKKSSLDLWTDKPQEIVEEKD